MHTCCKCGASLTGANPAGLCPRCFLREGLEPSDQKAEVRRQRSADEGPSPDHQGDHAVGVASLRPPRSSPHSFGDYELLEEIACGGMGIVYKARQLSLRRLVAVKMLVAGQLASEVFVKRLYVEAEAAAGLDHPDIVSIYEVGQHEGQPFFSMQFVEGPNLSQYAANLPGRIHPREAAQLLVRVARAVHYAHQRGILHRDLKPANILIDAQGQPHVTDFGLAKLMEADSDLTLSGMLLGTPSYMSPEQAAGNVKALTTQTDTYSLGAVLYFLLAGRPPFQADSTLELLKKVEQKEPERLRGVNPQVDRDLETICLTCLEKDPARRYASADALADDLEHWRRHEPIRARPTSRREHVAKWVKRNPALAGWALAAGLLAVVGLAGIVWQWRRADRNAAQETRQRIHAEATVLRLEMERAETLFAQDRTAAAVAQLARLVRRHPNNRVIAQRLLSALSAVGPSLPQTASSTNLSAVDGRGGRRGQPLALDLAISPARRMGIGWAEFSPDGQKALTVSADFTVRVWDVRTGRPVAKALLHHDSVRVAHFSPNGSRLATASADATARVWDAHAGEPLTPPLQHGDQILDVRFSSDGSQIVTASADGTARVWETATGRPVGRPLQHRGDPAAGRETDEYAAEFGETAIPEPSDVLMARFSPDGRRVGTACRDGRAWVWDVATGQSIAGPLTPRAPVSHICFSPDKSRLLTVSIDGGAQMWDLRTGQPLAEPIPHLRGLATDWPHLSPDGSNVVVLSRNTAQLCDIRSGQPTGHVMADAAVLVTAQFSPDGTCVALGSVDGTVRIWDVQTALPVSGALRHGAEVKHTEFSADGQWLLTVSLDGKARLWEVPAAPGPMPHWLPDLAEAVAGQRLGENDVREPVPREQLRNLRRELTGLAGFADFPIGLQGWSGGQVMSWAASIPYTLGWRFQLNQDVSVTALGVYSVMAEWKTHHQVGLWTDSGTLLAEVTVTASDPEVAQVRWVGLTNPLPLKAGQTYRIGANYPGPATDHFYYRTLSVTAAPQVAYLHSADNQGAGFGFPDRVAAYNWGYFGPNFQFSSPPPTLSDSSRAPGVPNRDSQSTVQGTTNRPQIAPMTADASMDFYGRWAKWFFASPATRGLSPSSSVTAAEYVRRRIEEDTLESLEEAVSLAPDNTVALTRLGAATLLAQIDSLDHAGKTTAALALADEGLLRHSDSVGLWQAKSGLLTKLDRLQDAHQAYTQVLNLTGTNMYRLARCRNLLRRQADGIWQTRRVAESRDAFSMLLRIAYATARECRDVALQDNYRALLEGRFYHGLDHMWNLDRLLMLAEQAVRLDPTDWRNFQLLGMAQYRDQQFTAAAETFQTEARLRNGELSARSGFFLAMTHQRLHETEKARDCFETARQRWETNFNRLPPSRQAEFVPLRAEAEPLLWPGLAKTEGKVVSVSSEATGGGAAEASRAIDGDRIWNLIARGKSLTKSDRLDDALAALAQAIELASTDTNAFEQPLADARLNRAAVLRRLNRLSEAGVDNCLAQGIPLRDSQTRAELVDLSPFYSSALTRDMQDLELLPGIRNDLSALPRGVQKFGTIHFDVRGLINLRGTFLSRSRMRRFPAAVTGIPLQRKVTHFHLLHGTVWPVPQGTPVGSYVLRFVDGQEQVFPVVYGVDVRDWQRFPTENAPAERVIVAWEGVNPAVSLHQGVVQLTRSTFENPRPQVEVVSLDFVSAMTDSAPFLVALTVE